MPTIFKIFNSQHEKRYKVLLLDIILPTEVLVQALQQLPKAHILSFYRDHEGHNSMLIYDPSFDVVPEMGVIPKLIVQYDSLIGEVTLLNENLTMAIL